MLLVETRGRIVGGALMFNSTLRAIGFVPSARGRGLGRRLLERLEVEATRHGRGGISLGVGREPSAARDFFAHMGYSGRSRMGKQLPLSAAVAIARGAIGIKGSRSFDGAATIDALAGWRRKPHNECSRCLTSTASAPLWPLIGERRSPR